MTNINPFRHCEEPKATRQSILQWLLNRGMDCFAALAMTMLLTVVIPYTARAADPVPVSTESVAIFAGGCFWCMESEFSHHKGISDVTSGYAGGEGPAPTYEQVSSGTTGFKEAIAVTYDPSIVSYKELLDIFWSNVDPFDDKGQFCDKGSQYIAAIFFSTKAEHVLAQSSLKDIEKKYNRKVATQILPQTTFYEAEDHHQDYADNNKVKYNLYKNGCGRPQKLQELKEEAAKKSD